MRKVFLSFCLSCALVGSAVAVEPDYQKETRWREQVADAILDGEEITLEGADRPFFAIWMESEEESTKAAILIHGSGVHPNWANVILPLRVGLTEHRYNTLSLQMPVLANGTELEEYIGLFPLAANRIAAAVSYLQDNGYEPELIVAHSLGSAMSAFYLANHATPVLRFVGIGMPIIAMDYLPDIKIDTLDLYGTDDFPAIIANAPARLKASARANFTQQTLAGDHFFTDQDDALLQTVIAWLP